MQRSAESNWRTLTSVVALLGAAGLGAGVSAVIAAPAGAPVTSEPVATRPIAAKQPVTPKPRAEAAPSQSAPAPSNIKATFVSGTTDSVTVEGVGTISGTPDVLLVGLQVTVEASTTRAALDGANGVVERVLSTLRAHGVARADIQTTGMSLYPTYDYDEGTQKKTGYAAGQSLAVKLRSADRRGETISAASGVSEDVTINGLSFDLENNAGLLARAQKAAFTMAKAEAARYASLAGRSLGRVMTINQVMNPPVPGSAGFNGGGGVGAGPAPASAVPLADGSLPVSVSVVVTWTLR